MFCKVKKAQILTFPPPNPKREYVRKDQQNKKLYTFQCSISILKGAQCETLQKYFSLPSLVKREYVRKDQQIKKIYKHPQRCSM